MSRETLIHWNDAYYVPSDTPLGLEPAVILGGQVTTQAEVERREQAMWLRWERSRSEASLKVLDEHPGVDAFSHDLLVADCLRRKGVAFEPYDYKVFDLAAERLASLIADVLRANRVPDEQIELEFAN